MIEPGGEARGDGAAALHEPDVAAQLWLDVLERVSRRSGHELKNALNAVALNLEVVRSRCANGGDARSLGPFATAAAAAFERIAAMNDALLALTRHDARPADVATIARLVAVLVGGREGATEVVVSGDGATQTSAPQHVARLCVASALLAGAHDDARVTCEIRGAEGILVHVARGGGAASLPAPAVPPAVAELAAAHGIRVVPGAATLDIIFPRLGDPTAAARGEG